MVLAMNLDLSRSTDLLQAVGGICHFPVADQLFSGLSPG
jgi:hypothetical protein